MGSPASTKTTSTFAPHGVAVSRCLRRHAKPLATESPGAIRSDNLARAVGTRVLLAPSTFGASKPVTLNDGLVQRRSTTGPDPIHSTFGSAPDSVLRRASG